MYPFSTFITAASFFLGYVTGTNRWVLLCALAAVILSLLGFRRISWTVFLVTSVPFLLLLLLSFLITFEQLSQDEITAFIYHFSVLCIMLLLLALVIWGIQRYQRRKSDVRSERPAKPASDFSPISDHKTPFSQASKDVTASKPDGKPDAPLQQEAAPTPELSTGKTPPPAPEVKKPDTRRPGSRSVIAVLSAMCAVLALVSCFLGYQVHQLRTENAQLTSTYSILREDFKEIIGLVKQIRNLSSSGISDYSRRYQELKALRELEEILLPYDQELFQNIISILP